MFMIGLAIGVAATGLVAVALLHLVRVVNELESVLVMRDGRVVRTLEEPGWHCLSPRYLFGTSFKRVSHRQDSRSIIDTFTTPDGASRLMQVWFDFKVIGAKAFGVADDVDRRLRQVVVQAVREVMAKAYIVDGARGVLTERLLARVRPLAQPLGVELGTVILNVSALNDALVMASPTPARRRAGAVLIERPHALLRP